MLISRGRCFGSASKTVGRPCGSAWVVTSPRGLVEQEQPRPLAHRQRLAVDDDAVGRGHIARRRCDLFAVDRDPAGGDPGLGLAPRRQPGARDRLGDAFALVLLAFVALACHDSGLIAEAAPRVPNAISAFKRVYAIAHDPENPMPSFMDLALDEARAAVAAGEVPVGCVIVRDGEVIAQAYNRTLADRDPTAHCEMLAIRRAAEVLASERLTDCDLYVTLEPCAMCAAAISFARIRRLYYGAADVKGGAVENGVRYYASPTCHHRPEVYGGMAEAEAAALLKDFFRARR